MIPTVHLITSMGAVIVAQDIMCMIFFRQCPYCDKVFEATNSQQKFCKDSHRVMYSQKGIAHAAC